jgi:hypothetical protein
MNPRRGVPDGFVDSTHRDSQDGRQPNAQRQLWQREEGKLDEQK